MKGFTVLRDGKPLHAVVENGVTSIVISNKEGHYSIYVGGTEANGLSYTWLSEALAENDVIEVRFEEFDLSSVSEAVSIHDSRDEEATDRLLLESYYRVKKELKDEGYDV